MQMADGSMVMMQIPNARSGQQVMMQAALPTQPPLPGLMAGAPPPPPDDMGATGLGNLPSLPGATPDAKGAPLPPPPLGTVATGAGRGRGRGKNLQPPMPTTPGPAIPSPQSLSPGSPAPPPPPPDGVVMGHSLRVPNKGGKSGKRGGKNRKGGYTNNSKLGSMPPPPPPDQDNTAGSIRGAFKSPNPGQARSFQGSPNEGGSSSNEARRQMSASPGSLSPGSKRMRESDDGNNTKRIRTPRGDRSVHSLGGQMGIMGDGAQWTAQHRMPFHSISQSRPGSGKIGNKGHSIMRKPPFPAQSPHSAPMTPGSKSDPRTPGTGGSSVRSKSAPILGPTGKPMGGILGLPTPPS